MKCIVRCPFDICVNEKLLYTIMSLLDRPLHEARDRMCFYAITTHGAFAVFFMSSLEE